MANVNEGHRARLRRRMMTEGLHGFQDHEILELLLFQSLPTQNLIYTEPLQRLRLTQDQQ